jgi:tRNA threonylcarbamoyladenosine biosynthesis protein TsaE
VTLIELPTPADTRDLGRRLAQLLRAGDLVILDGPLGAGKTVLAQGIGDGLGVRGEVTSPTFVIARVHRPDPRRGRDLPLVHVDAYRLRSLAEVDDLDLDTGLDDAVTVVEWGEGKVERLADAHLRVRLGRHDDDTRTAVISGVGGDWWERLRDLDAELRQAGAAQRSVTAAGRE